jgi:enediyne biosynthesis protein E7
MVVLILAFIRPDRHPIFFDLLGLITNPTRALTAIHKRHGDFVQTQFFNKNLVFVSNPEHYDEIFNLEAKGLLNRDSLYNAKKPMFGDGLFNGRGETWVNQRRLMQPLFTREAITSWQDIFIDEADSLVGHLKNTGVGEVNLSKEVKLLVQSIIIRIMFGRLGSSDKDKALINNIDTIVGGIFLALVTEVLGKGRLRLLFVVQNWRMEKAMTQFIAYVYGEIEKKKNEPPGNDIISMLTQANNNKSGYAMTKELLKDEAVTLFLAGQDTTVNTLVWFFYLIGKHEAVQQRIIEEIKQHKDDTLSPENLAKLKYTKAALQETLRLYPQATGLSRDAASDVVIGGERIKQGSTIVMSIYATHHDKNIWQRPEAFYPEHFLNQPEDGRHKYAFIPFGGGIHNCIGRHLAELEMMIIITTLLRYFKVNEVNDIKGKVSLTLKADRDLTVTLTPNSE